MVLRCICTAMVSAFRFRCPPEVNYQRVSGCQTTYYPDYCVHRGVRVYYEGLPLFAQVSDSRYVERAVLEHFLTLSLLSWTSYTNAAHIYHESLSRLDGERAQNPAYRLRTEHVRDGFILNALLKDARRRRYVLQVPDDGEQKVRFNAAMLARNQHIQQCGQPEFSHWCTGCVRRYDNPDGTAGMSTSCVSYLPN